VKRDTPDKVIHPGQSVHIDVDLALVNVTVTDPYDRVVTGLEPRAVVGLGISHVCPVDVAGRDVDHDTVGEFSAFVDYCFSRRSRRGST
jgi:hypothetical protein